jgi:uncharacterized phage protein (TIGR02218 family)
VSYEVLEASVEDAAPIYRFLFVIGTDEYRYTTASYIVGDSNGTWEPLALTASSVTQTNELGKNGLRLTVPRDSLIAQRFLGSTPDIATSLTIFRNHQPTDSNFDEFVYWKGRVASVEISGDQVTLNCEDIFTSMRRPGLRARYQRLCRHALYSQGCGVDQDNYAVPATIVAVDGNRLTYSLETSSNIEIDSNNNNDVSADNFFSGGIIDIGGVKRQILLQGTDTLELLSPFDDLDIDSVGREATLYPGCNRTTTVCLNRFDNLNNFGGFPYLPDRNPFANSVTGSIA